MRASSDVKRQSTIPPAALRRSCQATTSASRVAKSGTLWAADRGVVAVTNAEKRRLPGLFDERRHFGQCRASNVQLVLEPCPELENADAETVFAGRRSALQVPPRLDLGELLGGQLDHDEGELGLGPSVTTCDGHLAPSALPQRRLV